MNEEAQIVNHFFQFCLTERNKSKTKYKMSLIVRLKV